MSLAARLVTHISCLFGREVALLPFGNPKELIGCGFDLATHLTNIQAICINVQPFPSPVSEP